MLCRALIAPGESLKTYTGRFRLQSSPIDTPLLGAYFDLWAFYCPMRIAWAEWPEFIMGGTSAAMPTALGNRAWFEDPAKTVPVLFGNSIQAILDEYLMPGDTVAARMPPPDFTGEFFTRVWPEKDSVTVPIDVTSETFSLDDLEEAQAQARYRKRVDAMTASYEDYLAAHGVRVDDLVLVTPELLGSRRTWLWPSKAIDTTTGLTSQSYFLDVEFRLGRPRYFAEHGYFIVLGALRPKVLMPTDPQDTEWLLQGPERVPQTHSLEQHRQYTATILGVERTLLSDDFLWKGQAYVGNSASSPWSLGWTGPGLPPTSASAADTFYGGVLSDGNPLDPFVGQVDFVNTLSIASTLPRRAPYSPFAIAGATA